jgi:hypothetical protein
MTTVAPHLLEFERDKNTIVAGPTASGKTHLIRRILLEGSFSHTPEAILILSPDETSSWTAEDVRELQDRFDSVETILGKEQINNFLDTAGEIPENAIVVFDDFMTYLTNKELLRKMEHFSFVITHHRHLWTFWVVHNIFVDGLITIRRNTEQYILFDLLRGDTRAAERFLQTRFGPSVHAIVLAVWRDALRNSSHGWLRIDNKLHPPLAGTTVFSSGDITPDGPTTGIYCSNDRPPHNQTLSSDITALKQDINGESPPPWATVLPVKVPP